MVRIEEFLQVALLTPLIDPVWAPSPADPVVTWGIPVNLVGLSGIAKSARIKAVGKAIGLPVYPVYAATKQPEDFTGVVVQTNDGIVIECILPQARRCIEQGRGLIFLDEISCTRPATQAALLSALDERRFGDHLLPPKVRILLAMNPPEYAAGGHDLEPPLANRMAWKSYEPPTRDEWCSWLEGNVPTLPPLEDGEKIVCEKWADHWPSIIGLMRGFMQAGQNEWLHNQPKPDSDKSSAAWPSPRMWHWAACGVCTVRCLGAKKELEFEIVESLVGEAMAISWAEWVKNADLPHPRDMLTKGWEPDKIRLDRTMACLTSMVQYLKGRDRTDAIGLAEAGWKILQKTMKAGMSDIAVRGASVLVSSKLGRQGTPDPIKDIAEKVIYELTNDGFAGLTG